MTAKKLSALAYAELGWSVLRIEPRGKIPNVGKAWRTKATTHTETIEEWWSGHHTDDEIGILTGADSGIWVLDVDVAGGKQGAETLRALQAEHGKLPVTPTAITGSGGLHFVFAWDPKRPVTNGMASRLGPGLDIRGEGGQIVASPSVHPNGNQYRWRQGRNPWTTEPAQAPDWLYGYLEAPERATAGSPGPSANGDSPADHVRARSWDELLSAEGWTFHHADGDDQHWTRPGKAKKDGSSAVTHGEDGPLVVFSTEATAGLWNIGVPTADGGAVSVTKFDFLAATRYSGDRSAAASAVRSEMPKIDLAPDARVVNEVPSVEAEMRWAESRVLSIDQVLAIEPPEPMVGDWLDVGMLATMPGKYGSLKSFLAMSMCFSVATGRPWLGQKIHHQGPVLYCSLEGAYTLPARYQGWLEDNRVMVPPGNFHTWASSLNLLDDDEMKRFIGWLGEVQPLLVVIDTYSRATPGADENAKPDVSKAIRAFEKMRAATGGTILTTHHTGHNASGRGRGFSGLEDDIDVVLPVLGQWKDGPVQLTSAKQKARENPEPIWVGLDKTSNGQPIVVPAVEPEPDEADLGPLILAKIRRYPGELRKSHLSDSRYRDHKGYIETKVARQRIRDKIDNMLAAGQLKRGSDGESLYAGDYNEGANDLL